MAWQSARRCGRIGFCASENAAGEADGVCEANAAGGAHAAGEADGAGEADVAGDAHAAGEGREAMRIARALLLSVAFGVAVLPACTTSSGSGDAPALITNPTPASRAELRLAVQRALHSDPILLADDALTRSSLLTIDRLPRRDSHGRLLNGLDVRGRPEQFRLVRTGGSCVLIHEDSEQLRQKLSSTTCQRAPRTK